MERGLARLAVDPRLPVVVVLAVDDDATVFVRLNLIVARLDDLGWCSQARMTRRSRCAAGERALASTVIVLVLSLATPPAEDRKQPLPEVDSARDEDGRERQTDA
jgi:hypothetical protein